VSALSSSEDLPDDPVALRTLVAAERARHADERARHEAEIARLEEQITERDSEVERLKAIIHGLMRHRFGKRSEKLDPDQQALALDDLETALEAAKADEEERNPVLKEKRKTERSKKRNELPPGLPKIERVVDIDSKVCPCCGEDLHVIGEDKSSRLHTIPAQRFELITRRPKYACRACTDGVHQAPAPPSLVEGGLPTEATIAHMLVAKYADHLPVYRQWQMLKREGIHIERSVLIGWVGRGAWALKPVAARMLEKLKASTKLFCDEMTAPVLDPGRGRTKKGYLWSIARDDRPWGGLEPPGVVYSPASKACCRSTAIAPTMPSPTGASKETSRSHFAGRTCVENFTTSPSPATRRSPRRRSSASLRSTRSKPKYAAKASTCAAPCVRPKRARS
jgi:transposase